jgi:hypothetical protein
MKYLFHLFFACVLIACPFGLGQDQASPASVIELIANPEKFEGKLVSVQGFLRIGHEKHHGFEATLYLHQEDARNLLGSNMVLVIPSEQMLRDQEKIDRIYVVLTGVLRFVPSANGSHSAVIRDVRSCSAWSDPQRPVGEPHPKASKQE